MRPGLNRRGNIVALLFSGGVVAGFLLLAVIVPRLPSTRLSVHVDMYASGGSEIALYLNTLTVAPQVEPVHVGERAVYTFPVPYRSISRIRVDVAEQAGIHVLLYSITVTNTQGHLIADFGPSSLAIWARYFLTTPVPDLSALNVTSTAPGADVDAFQNVSDTSNLPGPLGMLVMDARGTTTRLALAFWGGAVVAAFALFFAKGRVKWLVAVSAIGLASVLALYESASHPGALESPVAAVGAAAFLGFSVATDTRAVYVMYALAAVIAVSLLLIDRRLGSRVAGLQAGGTIVSQTDQAGTAELDLWRPWIVAGFTLVVAIAAFLPDLRSVLSSARSEQYAPGWDSDNLLAWTVFATRGLIPMKDFWYPYDNDLIFDTGLLTGPMIYFLYQCVGILGYAWVFWRLSGRRVVLACLAVLGLAVAAPLIGEFPRYGFGFMISAIFCVVRATDAPRSRVWARLALTTVVAIAAFVEVDLLAYAAAGIAFVVIFEGAARIRSSPGMGPRPPGWRPWIASLLWDSTGPAVAVGAALLLIGVRGQLEGMIAFYGHPGTLDAYSAGGVPLLSGLVSLPSFLVLLVWFPAFTFGGAILLRWGVGSSQALLASTLASLAGAGVVLLTKDAVRPLTQDSSARAHCGPAGLARQRDRGGSRQRVTAGIGRGRADHRAAASWAGELGRGTGPDLRVGGGSVERLQRHPDVGAPNHRGSDHRKGTVRPRPLRPVHSRARRGTCDQTAYRDRVIKPVRPRGRSRRIRSARPTATLGD